MCIRLVRKEIAVFIEGIGGSEPEDPAEECEMKDEEEEKQPEEV